jgi:hypothetical protein
VASSASTPRNQQLANTVPVRKESTHSLVSEGQLSESKASEDKDGEDALRVESETPTPEDEDAQFDWDLKYIFKRAQREKKLLHLHSRYPPTSSLHQFHWFKHGRFMSHLFRDMRERITKKSSPKHQTCPAMVLSCKRIQDSQMSP